MILPRNHLIGLERPNQDYNTRLDGLRLDYNEMVPYLEPELFQAIKDKLTPELLTAYPEVKPVYEILANSLGVRPEQLVLTSGSDSGIKQIYETFCNEGDEVIITFPTYGMFQGYCELMNLSCKKVLHNSDDFRIAPQNIINNITERTKIIAIANPNGNVGSAMPDYDLEYIIKEAERKGVVVLLDQAYNDYYEDNWGSRIDEFDNLVIVRTFSKAWGIAGLRFGYILTNETLRKYIYAMKPVVEINSVAALVAEYLLTSGVEKIKGIVIETKKGKERLAQSMEELDFKVYRGYANFIQVWFGSRKEDIMNELRNKKIYVKDNGNEGLLAGSVRITVGPVSQMNVLINTIKGVLSYESTK
ncbi:hypothetical protein CN568_24150 [Bacillus pseudomycoides]|uniref:pyridoxal phosphate-dependent aminotransferase n=1 Tax=Bacillus TaxID=1386 RepID=UPI00035FA611|nr:MULTISPECIES: histidinol-phosphate transaminase [Bacillus]MCX2829465.1 histidinol-phosphate transaminase [Bacillus sp. DHT2]MDR4916738.1 histidinol-phosphate transaminase [Bacillus pseudomycoides]PEK39639.1 hypothetical protein CN691_02585 [Bacillus pseudomycoides]PEK66398.1 hypothetical protein CN593_18170 [Bacillus pseudomycoides]PEP38732.1 hypothetical protein CN568_24150 [Bacillus pseudomycoides]